MAHSNSRSISEFVAKMTIFVLAHPCRTAWHVRLSGLSCHNNRGPIPSLAKGVIPHHTVLSGPYSSGLKSRCVTVRVTIESARMRPAPYIYANFRSVQ